MGGKRMGCVSWWGWVHVVGLNRLGRQLGKG